MERSKIERKRHLNGAKKCNDFDGCEWGMGKIERKGIFEGRGVATWAPHRANKMRRRCTVAKYCASVMTKITYQRGLSRRLFAFCLLIQLSFHYRHVEGGGGYYPTYLDHANCKRVCQWHLIKKWWVLTVGANLKSFVKRPSSQRSKAAPPDDLCGTSFNIFPNQGGIKCGNRGTGFLDSEGSHR